MTKTEQEAAYRKLEGSLWRDDKRPHPVLKLERVNGPSTAEQRRKMRAFEDYVSFNHKGIRS